MVECFHKTLATSDIAHLRFRENCAVLSQWRRALSALLGVQLCHGGTYATGSKAKAVPRLAGLRPAKTDAHRAFQATRLTSFGESRK